MDVAARERLIASSDLASLLEYWMPFSQIEFTRKLGTWCDGIAELHIFDLGRTAFLIAGVGYFPSDSSPFELEFSYKKRRDLLTTRIVFRFGMLDSDWQLRTFAASKSPEAVLRLRPSDTQDWAVVVELTPEE